MAAAARIEMPHRTRRTYYQRLGLVREEFSRGNDAPCQQCQRPFVDYGLGYRLKTTEGKSVRGYGRVCYGCCQQKIDGLTVADYRARSGHDGPSHE